MVKKYLDDIGLAYFFEKLKSIFITREEVEEATSLVGSGSGVAVATDGVMVEALTVYGQSNQSGTPTPSNPVDVQVVQSQNLIPFSINDLKTYNTSGTWSDNTYTYRGINATLNDNGTITLNGTATGNFTFYLVANSNQLFLSDGNYTLTGELPGTGSDSTWYFQATTTTDSSGTVKARNRDYGSGVTFAVDSAVYGVSVYLHASTGDAFNNAVLKPQLVSGLQIKPFASYGSISLVTRGRNLFGAPIAGWLVGTQATTMRIDGLAGTNGTIFVIPISPNTDYTVSAKLYTGMNRFRTCLFKSDPRTGETFSPGQYNQLTAINDPTTDRTYTFSSGEFTWIVLGLSTNATALNPNAQAQLEFGSVATPYEAPNAIVVGGIDLQGNILASLPDGTRDVLTVDSVGAVTLTKRVGVFDASSITTYGKHGSIANWFYKDNAISDCDYAKGNAEASGLSNRFAAQPYSNVGDLIDGQFAFGTVISSGTKRLVFKCTSASTAAEFNTWIASNQTTLYYPLATPQTIDLGYTDMPAIPEGATISMSASMTPVIDVSWWTVFAEPIANAIKCLKALITS